MKGAFLIIFVVLITVFVAISHGFAKSTKEGSYIPHAWSQKLEASKRFEVVLDGGAVLDKETGLVWEKSPEVIQIHHGTDEIYEYVCDKEVGGRKGWRLPSVYELASLVDTTQQNPSLPKGHPFTNIQNDYYWTSTSWYGTNMAVSFKDGKVTSSYYDYSVGDDLYVWCVRGGY